MYEKYVRNNFYNERKYNSLRKRISYVVSNIKIATRMLYFRSPLKSKVILCGLLKGLTFNPKIKYPSITKNIERPIK